MHRVKTCKGNNCDFTDRDVQTRDRRVCHVQVECYSEEHMATAVFCWCFGLVYGLVFPVLCFLRIRGSVAPTSNTMGRDEVKSGNACTSHTNTRP